jgi:hypothetical protein
MTVPNNAKHSGTSSGPAVPASYLFDPSAIHSRTEQIFQGFLAKNELAVWIGHEKHRKTTLVLDLAVCAALGRDFLGFRFAAPGPLCVVMFDFESKDDSIDRRSSAICTSLELSDADRTRLWSHLHIIKLRDMIYDGRVVPKIDVNKAWWEQAVAEHPADLYIVDPFRCLHGGAENDSKIEEILRLIRGVFKQTTIIPHHTVKSPRKSNENVRLVDDMRLWSEQCRGSGAIKGHADVIICQEREIDADDTEVVHLGGFMKDAGDIDPIPLVESAVDSFWWIPQTKLPKSLCNSLDVLRQTGTTSWVNRSAVAATLILAGIKRPTAFRHIKQLIQRGALRERTGDTGITFAKLEGWSADAPKNPTPGADFRNMNFGTPAAKSTRVPTADEVNEAIRNLDPDRDREDPTT